MVDRPQFVLLLSMGESEIPLIFLWTIDYRPWTNLSIQVFSRCNQFGNIKNFYVLFAVFVLYAIR